MLMDVDSTLPNTIYWDFKNILELQVISYGCDFCLQVLLTVVASAIYDVDICV